MPRTGPESAPTVGVVIVNYASSDLIVENFAQLDLPVGGRIVVVDNLSGASERAEIVAVSQELGFVLVPMETNAGFGAGMAAGVDAAAKLGCTVFILANPDAVLTTSVVSSLVDQVALDPLTMVSPRILRPDGSIWFDGARVLVDKGVTTTARGSDSTRDDGWLSGACIAISLELWHASGGFDDDYFLYWEDVDLSWRVVEAGGALLVRSDLDVVHAVGGTQEGAGKSPLYVYYNCRNRLVFARKHLTPAQVRGWSRGSVRFAYRVSMRGGRRAFLRHPFSLSWAALRGTLDGLSGRTGQAASI